MVVYIIRRDGGVFVDLDNIYLIIGVSDGIFVRERVVYCCLVIIYTVNSFVC